MQQSHMLIWNHLQTLSFHLKWQFVALFTWSPSSWSKVCFNFWMWTTLPGSVCISSSWMRRPWPTPSPWQSRECTPIWPRWRQILWDGTMHALVDPSLYPCLYLINTFRDWHCLWRNSNYIQWWNCTWWCISVLCWFKFLNAWKSDWKNKFGKMVLSRQLAPEPCFYFQPLYIPKEAKNRWNVKKDKNT